MKRLLDTYLELVAWGFPFFLVYIIISEVVSSVPQTWFWVLFTIWAVNVPPYGIILLRYDELKWKKKKAKNVWGEAK